MEAAKITFYEIERCGYYRHGEQTPEFGNVGLILQQIKNWVHSDGVSLEDTCTYAIEESEDVLRTFCYDIVSDASTGDYLLTTWNETPSYDGKVAAVKGASKVGSAKVEFGKLPKNSIPGYATYFWFIPSRNLFATIRFQHRMNGKRGLDKYMKEYVGKLSDYVVESEDGDADFNIIGYADLDESNPQGLNALFRTSIVRKPGKISYIFKNRRSIRKIVRHNKLIPNDKVSKGTWEQAFKHLFSEARSAPPLDSSVNFSYEFLYMPEEDELKDMVREWEENHDSKWDDIGFGISGEQTPVWLSNSLARDDVDLDVKRMDEEVVDGKSILKEVCRQRDRLLTLLES
ncbi:hypothetical protein [Marinimicrobium agarilyticum]|uniref:hypothetical protein n=1 Tax=Marinimicrobium agarilyticum TaxID=306546 RepID=UPI0004213C93|nr:hypothetical protein [Marinimicrobium agarilyticum]